jgi:hypothetical protein
MVHINVCSVIWTKGKARVQRLNFTLDDATARLLETLAAAYYGGNKSQTVRAGHEGWVIAGYSPAVIDAQAACHTCGTAHGRGEVLYRPVFERGRGPDALPSLPTEGWLDCLDCVEGARRA